MEILEGLESLERWDLRELSNPLCDYPSRLSAIPTEAGIEPAYLARILKEGAGCSRPL